MSAWKQSVTDAYASIADDQSHPIYSELDKLTADMRADYDRMVADQRQAASDYIDRLAVGREAQIALRHQELLKHAGYRNMPENEARRTALTVAEQQIDNEIQLKASAMGQMHSDRRVFHLQDAQAERKQSLPHEFNREVELGLGE